MKATHPAAPMRPPADYEPGPPLIDGQGRYRIRSAADARAVLAADDHGGLTQNMHYVWAALAGTPGVPGRYADVHEMYQFAWAQGEHSLTSPGGQPVPCRHRQLLDLFEWRLTKPAVDAAAGQIRALAGSLLDELIVPQSSRFDVCCYARSLAFRSAAALAGIPVDDHIETTFLVMFDRFIRQPTVAVIPAADPAEQEFLTALLESRAVGLLADAAAARDQGQLTTPEALGMIRGWLHAGTDTTAGTLTTLLGFLASDQGQGWQATARRVTGPEQDRLLTSYVLEAARLWPTFPEIPLITYQPVTLPSGITIPANRQVLVVCTAADRDGDSLDMTVFRPGRRSSFAFGSGLHACAGKLLALTVAAAGTGLVLDRTTTLTLPEDGWVSAAGLITSIDRAVLTCTQ